MDNQTLIDIATDCLRRASNVKSYLIYIDGTEPLLHERKAPTLPTPVFQAPPRPKPLNRPGDALNNVEMPRLPRGFWSDLHRHVKECVEENPSSKIILLPYRSLLNYYDIKHPAATRAKVHSAISSALARMGSEWRTVARVEGIELRRYLKEEK